MNDETVKVFGFLPVEAGRVWVLRLVDIGVAHSWWSTKLRVRGIVIIVVIAPEVSLIDAWVGVVRAHSVMAVVVVIRISFSLMMITLVRHFILSLILVALSLRARVAILILLSVFLGVLQGLGDNTVMFLQFGSNVLGLLFSVGMALDLFFKLFLDLVKLVLPVLGLDFSQSLFIKAVIPYLFRDLVLNLLALLFLFLLLWGQWL